MVKLTVYQNDQIISDYEFDQKKYSEHEIFIGRADDCHLCIPNQQISRYHLSLTYADGIMALKKLSQYDSVFVNGKNVNNALISDTDLISFYDYQVKVSGLDEENHLVERQPTPTPKKEKNDFSAELSETIIVPQDIEEKIDDKNLEENDLSLLHEKMAYLDDFENQSSEEDHPVEVTKPKEEVTEFRVKLPTGTSSDVYNDQNNDNDLSDTIKLDDFQKDNIKKESKNTSTFNMEDDEDVLEFSESEDIVEQHFQEDQGFGDLTESHETTQVYENFAQFYLNIYGDGIPYQRYLIDRHEVTIGRSKSKCNIVIDDDDVSSIHARVLVNRSEVILEDLGSANGTVFNGQKINKVKLTDRDKFTLGGVTFELRVSSMMLAEENKILMPVESEQEVIREEIIDSSELGDLAASDEARPQQLFAKIKYDFNKYLQDPKKKRIFYIVVIGIAILLLVDDPSTDNTENTAETNQETQVQGEGRTKTQVAEKKRSGEEKEYLSSHYLIAKSKLEEGDYSNALYELDLVRTVDPDYMETEQLVAIAKEGLRRIEEEEKKQKEEEERKRIELEIKKLLAKAEEARKNGQLDMAQTYLNQIAEYDPEHSALAALKIEIETAKKDQEKLKEEQEERDRLRKLFLSKLTPAKKYIADKKWFKASKILEELLVEKNVDKALMDEATSLYESVQKTITEKTDELLSKAEEYKRGQDYKNAYEMYRQTLDINPNSSIAHKAIGEIRGKLDQRAKAIYREALVSESISLFDDAKEKFIEVLQIAPSDSEYYKKADVKLKEYYVE